MRSGFTTNARVSTMTERHPITGLARASPTVGPGGRAAAPMALRVALTVPLVRHRFSDGVRFRRKS
jgi:hypothetical protein